LFIRPVILLKIKVCVAFYPFIKVFSGNPFHQSKSYLWVHIDKAASLFARGKSVSTMQK
jgi:hypothetical protein